MMNVVRKAVSALGGIFLAALLIAALAPKATRGIAAALVQVVNTTANPVPNQDVTRSASQLVNLLCVAPFNGCIALSPGEIVTSEANYVVPVGQQLVITDIEASTTVGLTDTSCSPGCTDQVWVVANDGTTHFLHFGSGIVVPGGNTVNVFSQTDTYVQGYLTPN